MIQSNSSNMSMKIHRRSAAHRATTSSATVPLIATYSLEEVVMHGESSESFMEGSEKQVVPENNELIREAPIGKGIAGALKLLKERGALKETIDKDRQKEDFRLLCHRFHGKGPGKTKQEKRQRLHELELKSKRVNCSDTPLETIERLTEVQAQLKTPYLILNGHPKPGI